MLGQLSCSGPRVCIVNHTTTDTKPQTRVVNEAYILGTHLGLGLRVYSSKPHQPLQTHDMLSSVRDPAAQNPIPCSRGNNIGALIIRIGSWGPLYYK